MPKNKRITLQKLARYSQVDTAGISVEMGMPTNTVHRWLEDLSTVRLVDRIKTTNADEWRLRPKYRKLLKKFAGVEELDEKLTEYSAHLPEDELNAVKEDAREDGMSPEEVAKVFTEAPEEPSE